MEASEKLSIVDIVKIIVFFLVLAGICVLFNKACSEHEQYLATQYVSEYIGYYGNVFNRYTIEFDTYEKKDGSYLFYDNNGILVADVPTEGNSLSIMKRP